MGRRAWISSATSGRHDVVAATEPDDRENSAREPPALLVGDVDPPDRGLAREAERELGLAVIQRVPVEELADPKVQGLDGGVLARRSLGWPPPARALGLPMTPRGAARRALSMPTRRLAALLALLGLPARARA